MSCRDLELLIGRPAATLSEPERLLLEHHLVACEACRREHALARSFALLGDDASFVLRDSERQRAITGALNAKKPRVLPAPRVVGAWWAAAAVVLLASASYLWARKGEERLAVQAIPRSSAARPEQFLPARQVESAPVPAAAEPAAFAEVASWIEVRHDETRKFAHARVALRAGTRARFDAAERVLEVARGSVDVKVDPKPHRSFAVQTQRFRAIVLGTQFVVTPQRVDVRHGHVEVRSLAGELLADLHDGEGYPQKIAPRAEDLGELLASVRAALASNDSLAARALLQRANELARKPVDRAEALTLSAECALLERDSGRAVGDYLAVFERYPTLPAGENALYAAAQLRARERDATAARQLFERYLTSYPRGRFADEAHARLGKLAHESP